MLKRPDPSAVTGRIPLQVAAPFQVVDLATSRVLLEMVAGTDGPALRLYSREGEVLAEVGADWRADGGGYLSLFDGQGRECLRLGTHPHGGVLSVRANTTEGPSANLYADHDVSSLDLNAGPSEWNGLTVKRQ